jgi:HEAT repeat protein
VISNQVTAAQVAGGQVAGGQATTMPAETAAETAARDMRQQQATLADPTATSAQREEAARRLVSRANREANDALLRGLRDYNNREAQVAVARGLASDPTPEAMFIEPLSDLLGSGATLTEAAAQALVTFKGNDFVRDRLTNFANTPTNTQDARMGVILAMGKLVDQKAAAALINLLNTDTNPRIRDTAADALAEMTGLPRSGDVQGWNQWWAVNEAKTRAEFSEDLLNQMATRRAELDKRLRQMREAVDQNLRGQYRAATSDAEKTKVLMGHLQSTSEDMRVLGVRLIDQEATQFRAVPAPVFEQLRKMVGDSSAFVRLDVARTLGKTGEPGAIDPLLTQLAQESDPTVRAEIVWALGPTHDLRAIEPLLNALNDADTRVVRNAADALSNLATDLRKPQNAARGAEVAAQLNRRMEETPANIANEPVRIGLAIAMQALGHPSSRELLQRLVAATEPTERVRIYALRGLGTIGNPASSFFIAPALADGSKLVQVEAIRALKTCSDGFGGTANSLRPRIGKEEPDPEVRAAAWETLSVLFNQASPQELRVWSEHLKNDPDVSRRLRVLEELEERYAAEKAEQQLALNRQLMGEQYLKLNQPEKAVEKTKQALDYFDSFNAQESFTQPIVLQLMEARLRTKKYADAVDYALERVQRNPQVLNDLYLETKKQIERLKKVNDLTGALELITQFKRLNLPEVVSGPLEAIEREIKHLQSTGGRVWVRSPKAYEHVARFPFHML